MSALVELEDVGLRRGKKTLLDGVSLSVERGERIALAGPSGAGKTSLLRLVLGLLAPSAGVIRLRGEVVSEAGRIVVAPEERRLAMVFQDLALWPHLSVSGNLDFALAARGEARSARRTRIAAMLNRVGLTGFEERAPATLSGGERQRLAIARALVTQPDLVLFDEPLAGLDVALAAEMLALIADLLDQDAATSLHVTHGPSEARKFASRLVILEAGRVTQLGTMTELAAAPQTPFVRAFAAAIPEP